MNIAFLTNSPHAACSEFYARGLQGIECNIDYLPAVLNNPRVDWKKYDILLVMTYDHAICKELKSVIKKESKIGLIDPRGSKVTKSAEVCDFLIIDSIEMEDFWRSVGKPIIRYAEYPWIGYFKKNHGKKEKITIGYHGNITHLNEMRNSVTPALKELSKNHNIELMVMYNGAPPTGKEPWIVNTINTVFVPWSYENYGKYLSTADIGIVPSNLIVDVEKIKSSLSNQNPDNYHISFKMPTNPGRIITFGQLGIPVVADFFPSALELLSEERGYVANSKDGWKYCLENLILSHELRQHMSDRLQSSVFEKFDYQKQNKRLLNFLTNIKG